MSGAVTTTPADIAVVEDVWGEQFEALGNQLRILREPSAWSKPDRLIELLTGVRALVVRNRTQVTRDLLSRLPSLRVVARAGVGLDNIDLAAAEELGVVVVAARGANAASVAEYTIGAVLALARRLVELDHSTRAGEWSRTPGRELTGGTWGLLGLGATGRRVAALATALGMDVVAHDPYLEGPAPDGVRTSSLIDAVEAADVLSVHVPVTPQTRAMVGTELLAHLKPGALLVNVARGEILDEQALIGALESGHLGGAALDVRTVEPPRTGRLEQLDNVLLTPHVAGITAQSQHRIAGMLASDIARVLEGNAAEYAIGAVRPTARRLSA